jgi:hypothetical protein
MALITVGRSGFPDEVLFFSGFPDEVLFNQPTASRYATFAIPAVAALYAVFAKLVWQRSSIVAYVLFGVVLVLVLVSVPFSYRGGVQKGEETRTVRESQAFVALTHESQPDELLEGYLHPNVQFVRDIAPLLERLRYNVFAEPQEHLPPPLDGLVLRKGFTHWGAKAAPKRGYVKVTGWAVDKRSESAAGGVYVTVDGRPFPAFYGLGTNEVADRFGKPAYERAGFARSLPVSSIEPGRHELSVLVLTRDGKSYYRPNQKLAFETR